MCSGQASKSLRPKDTNVLYRPKKYEYLYQMPDRLYVAWGWCEGKGEEGVRYWLYVAWGWCESRGEGVRYWLM